jgi:ubiquinone/menaquinone biosynthesis C-methylase UbiE
MEQPSPSLSVREDIQYLSAHRETLTSLSKEQRTPQNPAFERALEALENIQRVWLEDQPLPPPRMRYGTTGTYSIAQFYALGAQTAALIHQLGNLKSNSIVLEVGTGAGRIALPLWWYLGEGGKFYGIDVNKKVVEHMQRVYGNARREFLYMDVYSERYNPAGKAGIREYQFEFTDALFDVIYLSSVFTHMRLPAITHYLQEFRRLLKPGGRVVFSAFLYDPVLEEKAWHTSAYAQSFVQIDESPGEKSWTVNPQEPERTIAFLLASFKQRLEDAGLHLTRDAVWGRWTGNPDYTLWQDFVVAERPR